MKNSGNLRDVMTYKNKELKRALMTDEQIEKLIKSCNFDAYLNSVVGKYWIRTRSGKILRHSPQLPRIGSRREMLLFSLMENPRIYMSAYDISQHAEQNFGANTYDVISLRCSGNMRSGMTIIRHAFGETAKTPHYFKDQRRPCRHAYHEDRSFCLVRNGRPVAKEEK